MAENFILIESKDMDIIVRPDDVSRVIKTENKLKIIMKDGQEFSFELTERFSGMHHFHDALTQ